MVTRERLKSKIDGVMEGLNLLRDDHQKLKERVTQFEKTLSDLQPTVTEIRTQMMELTDRDRFLDGRAEDAEGRNRKRNLRIVGLPEGEEGNDPLAYLEQWITDFMPHDKLTTFFSLE